MVFVPVRRRLSPSLTDGRRRGSFLPSCCCCKGLRVGRRISQLFDSSEESLFSLSLSLSRSFRIPAVCLWFKILVAGHSRLRTRPKKYRIFGKFFFFPLFLSRDFGTSEESARERKRGPHTEISNRAFEVNTEIAGSVSEL
jgi:hypothetical protein